MKRHFILLCSAALLFSAPGCLFVHHSVRHVRDKEPRGSVQFESEQAQRYFLSGVHDLQSHKKASDVEVTAIPFICVLSSVSELSDNAIYNDQITACDTNGDRLITEQEAVAYRAIVAERIRGMETKQSSGEVKQAAREELIEMESVTKPSTASPPALIHINTESKSP